MRNFESEDSKEIYEVLAYVNRCVKVVKGGRKMSFSAIILAGDKKGRLGVGFAKAVEVVDAKEKASRKSRKNLFKIPLREGRTIHHDIVVKSGASRLLLRSAPPGTGVIAGGVVRSALELLGIKDVVAKSIGSTNPHNVLRALEKALKAISHPRKIAEKRRKKISEIIVNRGSHPSSIVNRAKSGEEKSNDSDVSDPVQA